TPLNNRPVDRPAAVAEERRDVERGLRDNRLRIDRKPRLPLCLQDVAALEILVADRQLRQRPGELTGGRGCRVDQPLLDRPAARLPLADAVNERNGLGGALFLREVELQHCLTAIREGYRHSQRDVPLPEGLAEPERPMLGALLRKPRQRLQPSHPACSIAPPAQPL